MLIGLLGIKKAMHSYFKEDGSVVAATEVELSAGRVAQIKDENKFGYNAIQIAYYFSKACKTTPNRPEIGYLNKIGFEPTTLLREFRLKSQNCPQFCVGDQITIASLENVDRVSVQGRTIGKGFAGNIKKNNFNRGPMSHGSKHHRLQGSLGAGTTPSRVFPGKKMSGHLGATLCTIKNLEILSINKDQSKLFIKGSVPGKIGSLLTVEFENV